MQRSELLSQFEQKLRTAQSHFEAEIKKLRTGRANASMLDGVVVEAYGAPMPLLQVGSVSVPEPQLLQITPFDPNNIDAISSAIRNNQSLDLNPSDDGRVVRIPIPPLTSERRQLIAKQLTAKVEDTMISMRSARHELLRELDQAKKDKDIGEDDHTRYTKQVDELMQRYKQSVETIAETKEKEIMTL